jgi:hypothetical protein
VIDGKFYPKWASIKRSEWARWLRKWKPCPRIEVVIASEPESPVYSQSMAGSPNYESLNEDIGQYL